MYIYIYIYLFTWNEVFVKDDWNELQICNENGQNSKGDKYSINSVIA